MSNMSGGQALVRQLRSEGVDTVFALPGVQIMKALDGFYELRDDVRLVQTRHEQGTTYMAYGYAKVTGLVGVALVVPGPGALNAILAIGIFNIPVFARLTRGAALGLWSREFILAARVAGKGRARISAE